MGAITKTDVDRAFHVGLTTLFMVAIFSAFLSSLTQSDPLKQARTLKIVPDRQPDTFDLAAREVVDVTKPNPFMRVDKTYLYYHIPYSIYSQTLISHTAKYKINSWGFRSPEVAARPQPGFKRLLLIGDSLLEGAGQEFETTAAARLNVLMAPEKWEVVDAAIQGAGPMYYASNLPRYFALHPDAAVVMLGEEDALDDYMRESARADAPVGRYPENLALGLRDGWLISHLASMGRRSPVRDDIDRTQTRIEAIYREHKDPATNTVAGVDSAFVRRVAERKSPLVLPEEWDVAWGRSFQYLDVVAERFKAEGIPLYVMTILPGHTWANYGRDEFPGTGVTPFWTHGLMLQESVREWATRHGIDYFNSNVAFEPERFEDARPPYMYHDDTHLNPEGNRRMAEKMQPWLLERLPK